MHALMTKDAIRRQRFIDAVTFDQRTVDSTGAFLIGELERLDQTLNEPLVNITWGRDIDLREDVSIADETSSFTNSTFAAVGGFKPTGKAWIGKDSTQIANIALDIGKTAQPLLLWGMEVSYTIPELESAQKLGRPIDSQKLAGMNLKHQMDVDEMVYIGDTDVSRTGLLNSAAVTNLTNVATGVGGFLWTQKTPDEILKDVNELLTSVWAASGWAVCPSRLLVPPSQFGYLAITKVSTAGNMSLLKYLEENSIALRTNGRALEILPSKWLVGRGVSNADRMVAYTKSQKYVRFPLVPLQRTPLEYRSLFHITTYFGRLGCMEFVYPETIGYRDGI